MHTIGVIHLDHLASRLATVADRTLLSEATSHIALLEQCHSVENWVVMAHSSILAELTESLGHKANLSFVATPERDALDTFYRAAIRQLGSSDETQLRKAPGKLILRVTPDLEVIDPAELNAMLRQHRAEAYDYSSNNMLDDGPRPTVEIINLEVLDEAWREALLPDDRDLITPYITRQRQRLNLGLLNPAHLPNSRIESTYF